MSADANAFRQRLEQKNPLPKSVRPDDRRSGNIATDGYAVLDQAMMPPPESESYGYPMPVSPSRARRGLAERIYDRGDAYDDC